MTSTRTKLETAAAAAFAFTASALVCGALLVASMSAAPAQFFPGAPNLGPGNVNNGGNTPNGPGEYKAMGNGAFSANMDHSSVQNGTPSTQPSTLGTTRPMMGVRK